MIEFLTICIYCRASCALLILNCDTISKNFFLPKENELFYHFTKADNSVKNKVHHAYHNCCEIRLFLT